MTRGGFGAGSSELGGVRPDLPPSDLPPSVGSGAGSGPGSAWRTPPNSPLPTTRSSRPPPLSLSRCDRPEPFVRLALRPSVRPASGSPSRPRVPRGRRGALDLGTDAGAVRRLRRVIGGAGDL